MSDTPRQPPYPADTRAKGWRFEVDMEKVKASDTWLRAKTGALRGALLLLWSEAWQQTPCGSLPNDDELVSLLIDMPAATFAKSRAVLMRGWWLASDGRLYHDTIATRVFAMLEKRAKDAGRTASRRARAAGPQDAHAGVTRDTPATNALPDRESDTKHQAPSTRTNTPQPPAGGADGFERFWSAWPSHVRKVAKKQCLEKWVKRECEPIADRIVAHVESMKQSESWRKDKGQFIPAPLVYLNQSRWEGALEGEEQIGEWHETLAGVEKKAMALGLGKWDQLIQFSEYRGRVMAAAGAQA